MKFSINSTVLYHVLSIAFPKESEPIRRIEVAGKDQLVLTLWDKTTIPVKVEIEEVTAPVIVTYVDFTLIKKLLFNAKDRIVKVDAKKNSVSMIFNF